MGQKELTEGRPLIGVLIVVLRVPVGIVGTLVVTAFFATWLILETTVAVLAFPPAAIIVNQDWIRRSWLGRYPIALREFSRDGFKCLRVVWHWVTDPMEGVDLGGDMAEAPPVLSPAERAPPTTEPAQAPTEPASSNWWETIMGCLGCGVLAFIGFCILGALANGCK